MEHITSNKGGRKLAFENNIYIKQKVLSNGTVWGDIMGDFVQGDFVWGDFVLGEILSRGILSGWFCLGGFCPRTDKLTSKPTYVSSKIFNENLMAVHKIKETLTLNRPAYVGMCILDLSKTLMYDFHYNYIKKKYNDRAKLLFTDTDSLTYEIKTVDAYKDFWTDKDMFDNSDYPENSPYYCNTNKKIIGKFKDEACGIPITEFVGLKSKMYSYVKDNEKGGKTAKGIKKNVIKNNIRYEDYERTLLNEEQMHHKMKTIRSQRHKLSSYEINKVSLSCFDDKHYIHDNGTSSYAYGHYKI